MAAVAAQTYRVAFRAPAPVEGRFYIAQHFRDQLVVRDSTLATGRDIVFEGSLDRLPRAVYVLCDASRKPLLDFVMDGSRRLTIAYDASRSNAGMQVKGSPANQSMYRYMARLDAARAAAAEWRDADDAEAQRREDSLTAQMRVAERRFFRDEGQYLFTQLVRMFAEVEPPAVVPDSVPPDGVSAWRARFVRDHYWDSVDLHDRSLIYTPHLFNKMNYFFFGLLYHADADEIRRCAFATLDRVADDSTMLRYFLDFLVPRYERSSRIGWDQVYVDLVKRYYLGGRCSWCSEAELYSRRRSVVFLSRSLIGARGVELLMPDTNQSADPADWISSHRFPEPYVILWFWDPDCTHCQRQTAELASLYDSLATAGEKLFEVYAVGYESDVEKWKRYVRDHRLPFVNVGGLNVNVDYQAVYNVHGAPTMIILDEERRIIMNKTIRTDDILPFLRQDMEKKRTQHRDNK